MNIMFYAMPANDVPANEKVLLSRTFRNSIIIRN